MGSENPSPFHLQYLPSADTNWESTNIQFAFSQLGRVEWRRHVSWEKHSNCSWTRQVQCCSRKHKKAIYKLHGHTYNLWVLLQPFKTWQLLACNRMQIKRSQKRYNLPVFASRLPARLIFPVCFHYMEAIGGNYTCTRVTWVCFRFPKNTTAMIVQALKQKQFISNVISCLKNRRCLGYIRHMWFKYLAVHLQVLCSVCFLCTFDILKHI